jgi:endonuclease I
MKKLIFSILTLLGFSVFAQIPAGYYNSATGSGYTLKTQLHNIINDHNDQGYSALWDLYTTNAFRDNFYEDNGSLLDIYSENPSGDDAYEYTSTSDQCGDYNSESDCYNREHLFPQGYFNSANPMKGDAHFVVPSDGWVNNKRGSYPFGRVNTATYTSSNGSKLGNNLNSGYSSGYADTVFEPIDEFKGDVARAMFYVATRYEDVIGGWSSWDMVDGTNTQVYDDTFLNILLTWNTIDPVSDYEIARNNEIYYNFQGNRNPFIDHPEWVNAIWGTSADIDEVASLKFNIYPNPVSDKLFIELAKNQIVEISIFNVLGKKVLTKKQNANQSIEVSHLNTGLYLVEISNENSVGIAKMLKQ